MATTYTWRIAGIVQETADALTITFDTGNDEFSYYPGQYINLILSIGGEPFKRSYSLSSTYGIDPKPAITVKRIPHGVVSNFVFDEARLNAEWQVEGPFGFFYPSPAATEASQVVMIAAGSGITPIYAQIKYLLQHSDGDITLINCNRTTDDIIYADDLAQLQTSFSSRFHIWNFLSQQPAGKQENAEHLIYSRLSKLLLKKVLRKQLADKTSQAHYFLCGPGAMLDMTLTTLREMSVAPEQINREYFTPPEKEEQSSNLPDAMMEVLLHFRDQTNLLEVEPGETILQAALRDLVKLPYSCKAGTCGQCAGRLLGGKIHMAANYAIPQDKLNEGYILLCQSHPIDNDVTIEAYPAW